MSFTGWTAAPLPAVSQAANLTHFLPVASNGISKWFFPNAGRRGKLVEVRIYPADLGRDFDRTISKAGLPMTPSPANAQKILKVLQDASKAVVTTIAVEDNVGVIRVPASATASIAAP